MKTYEASPLYQWRTDRGFSRRELAQLIADFPKETVDLQAELAGIEGAVLPYAKASMTLKRALAKLCPASVLSDQERWFDTQREKAA